MARTLFSDAVVYRPLSGEPPLAPGWILVDGARVLAVGAGDAPAADETVDLAGAEIWPGLVNAHTHLYSALAGRLPWPAARPTGLPRILEEIWWRLDRALDARSIRISARLGLVEALRHGTTTVIDHHSSPLATPGSLDLIAREAAALGVKVGLAFEVSDRNGDLPFQLGVDENLRALGTYATHPSLRALCGLHASFTLSEASLERIADLVPFETPFHLHCAEAEEDLAHARSLGYESVVDRLASLGILRPGTLLAHCVHLGPGDAELMAEIGAYVVHCPQSNAHNRVGPADVMAMLGAGVRVGLGTDGFASGMLTEARFARDLGAERGTLLPRQASELLLAGGAAIASSVFGRSLGRLEAGEDADFIVLAPGEGGLGPHRRIRRVVSRGRTVCLDGELPGVDLAALHAEADAEAARLWERIQAL
jgi:cytosine/adenosine deaminase-related metal-dependent hydrolase